MKKIIIALMMATMVCLVSCQNPSGEVNSVIKNSTGRTVALRDDTGVIFAIVENGCTEDLKTTEKVVTIYFGYKEISSGITWADHYWRNFTVTTSIELYIDANGNPQYLPL